MNKLSLVKKCFSVLNKKEKTSFIGLIFFGVFSSAFELFSLLIIGPAFQLLLKTKGINDYKILAYLNTITGELVQKNIISFILLLLFTIFFIKLILAYTFNWRQSNFVTNFETRISSKLYESYISKNYNYFIYNNSSKLITTLTHEIDFVSNSINSILIFVLECSIILGAFMALLILEFKGTIIVSVFLIFAVSIFNLFQKKIFSNFSKSRYNLISNKYKILNQSFLNIKDVKIFGIESFLLKNYNNIVKNDNRIRRNLSFIAAMPRNYLELVILTSISILFFYFSFYYQNIIIIVPLFSVYLLSLFRILPSLNKLLNCLQQIKLSSNAINIIYDEFKSLEIYQQTHELNENIITFKNNLEIFNLSFKYDSSDKFLFNNINLSVKKGMKVGIIGESGAGKTTFIDLLLGLLKPCSGSVLVDGVNINNSIKLWQSKIGYVQQSIFLSDYTIKENIAYGVSMELIDEEKISKAISISNIDGYINSLPNGINTIIGENGIRLSGGQRQRLAIARALYRNPEIIIFDEATSALDENNETEIIHSIYSLNYECTIFIISHKLSILQNCDIIYKISDGKLLKYAS